MTALVLPTTSMPGQEPQESGGRLINCFAESLGEKGPAPFKIVRVPGLKEFGTTGDTAGSFRGGIQVGSLVYTAWAGNIYTNTSSGGAASALTGTLTGTDPVFFARNNAATPGVVCVSPSEGAFTVSTTAVASYSATDADIGSPNSVCFLKGYFIFSYGDGDMQASGLNAFSIDTNDRAAAESRPDTLYRVLARGDTLVAAGSQSIEFWGVNGESSGFPFSPITTHDRGIAHRYCIAGDQEGWGYGIFFVADDFTVRQLEGYGSVKVSPPDLDRLIAAVTDKEDIQVSVYVTQGHPMVVVKCDDWTWEYDVLLKVWHERKSYNLAYWRGMLPFKGFDKWLCGASHDANVYEIDHLTRYEDDLPLVAVVETAPQGNFPYGARVNRLDLFVSANVGIASGTAPIETDPRISIYISKDLGLSWSNAWIRSIGPQGQSPNVTVNNLGLCGPKGVKFKFEFSDPRHFALMGGDFQATPLRN